MQNKEEKPFIGLPLEVQLEQCRGAAISFGKLCRAICESLGTKGVKMIRNVFLTDCEEFCKKVSYLKGSTPQEIGMTLVGLLVSWGAEVTILEDSKEKFTYKVYKCPLGFTPEDKRPCSGVKAFDYIFAKRMGIQFRLVHRRTKDANYCLNTLYEEERDGERQVQ